MGNLQRWGGTGGIGVPMGAGGNWGACEGLEGTGNGGIFWGRWAQGSRGEAEGYRGLEPVGEMGAWQGGHLGRAGGHGRDQDTRGG